jgi:hypothetical protein
MDPHSRNRGDGNILYGFIFTTVRVNSDLTTFVRDKQSVATCNTSIRMRIKFRPHVIVIVAARLGGRDTKDMFHKTGRAKGPGLLNIRFT